MGTVFLSGGMRGRPLVNVFPRTSCPQSFVRRSRFLGDRPPRNPRSPKNLQKMLAKIPSARGAIASRAPPGTNGIPAGNSQARFRQLMPDSALFRRIMFRTMSDMVSPAKKKCAGGFFVRTVPSCIRPCCHHGDFAAVVFFPGCYGRGSSRR